MNERGLLIAITVQPLTLGAFLQRPNIDESSAWELLDKQAVSVAYLKA
jgi:hypothetical protein